MNTGAILTYHSIDRSGSVLSISPELFAWQMGALAEAGIAVVPLKEVRSRAGAVALTFDDGYRTFYTEALPVLRRFGHPATVFAIAGERSAEPGPGAGLPLMTWNELAEAARCRVEIGAHTLRHLPLTRLPAEQACEEIASSQQVIQQRLGAPVESFAYPYGGASPALRDFVRARFAQGVGVRLAYLGPDDDRAELPRLDVYYLRKRNLFGALFSAGVRRYIRLRRAARELRAHANFLQRSRPLR